MSPTATFWLAVVTLSLTFLNIAFTTLVGVFALRQTKIRDAQGHELARERKPESFRSHLYTEYFCLIHQLSTVPYDVFKASERLANALPYDRWFVPIFDHEGEERVTIEEQEEELLAARNAFNDALVEVWRTHVLSTAILDPDSLLALVEFRRRATHVGRQRKTDKASEAVEELNDSFEQLAQALRNGANTEELTAQTKIVIGVDRGRDALPRKAEHKEL